MDNMTVETVLERIAANVATREEIFAIFNKLWEAREAIPPRLELAYLQCRIADEPDNKSLKGRMVTVYNIIGQEAPRWLKDELAPGFIAEEYEVDFQKSMKEYGDKAGNKDMDESFFPLFEQVRSYTMTSTERLYALWNIVKYLSAKKLPGDFVEVGVWRGGSMMLAALTLLAEGDMRNLWLYDTFAGLPRPDETLDIDILGNRAINGWRPRSFDGKHSFWAYSPEEETRSNMLKTGYPQDKLHFIKGMVEDTMPAILPDKIALLRLDTDFYSSYKHVLNNAWDRIVPGGICILDDYGHFNGARQATDEFLTERNIRVLMHRPDYASRVFVKEN